MVTDNYDGKLVGVPRHALNLSSSELQEKIDSFVVPVPLPAEGSVGEVLPRQILRSYPSRTLLGTRCQLRGLPVGVARAL